MLDVVLEMVNQTKIKGSLQNKKLSQLILDFQ